MSKITGLEMINEVPSKVLRMYQAVLELLDEGEDASSLRVSTITERAGIGKGTAYEYFDTKEEIVACAVVYHLQALFDWLGKTLLEMDSFEEQLDYLLDEMEKKDGRKYCFIRFVHILTDNSEFSLLVQQKIESEKLESYMPMAVFGNVMHRAVERGELRDDLPMDYMVYSVFSHLLTYMMAVTSENSFRIDAEKIKPLVRTGILNELCKKIT